MWFLAQGASPDLKGQVESADELGQQGARNMLKSIRKRWETRKRYRRFSDMSDWQVAVLGIFGFLVAGYLSFALARVIPDYLRTANNLPLYRWGWRGWLLSAILVVQGLISWAWGTIAWRCNDIIRDRWFK
ncbi:hypothetical protein [Citrifermentans bremense]|uniref:Uncharacterized protein n=1 Tax=Citrifermentans bremense TaxID=60035 RepID=A0A6S6LXL5_9BACT|nr:hypothetical protein [Citrifermentans bremense]